MSARHKVYAQKTHRVMYILIEKITIVENLFKNRVVTFIKTNE